MGTFNRFNILRVVAVLSKYGLGSRSGVKWSTVVKRCSMIERVEFNGDAPFNEWLPNSRHKWFQKHRKVVDIRTAPNWLRLACTRKSEVRVWGFGAVLYQETIHLDRLKKCLDTKGLPTVYEDSFGPQRAQLALTRSRRAHNGSVLSTSTKHVTECVKRYAVRGNQGWSI